MVADPEADRMYRYRYKPAVTSISSKAATWCFCNPTVHTSAVAILERVK